MPGAWSPAPPRRFCRRATTSRFPAASACGECWGGCLRPWDQQPALDPTPPPPGCAPTHASRTPCLLHPLVPTALGPGGDLGQGKGQPPPQPRFPHTRVPPQGGQELGLWEGGAGGAVREGFLEEVVPGRAPGHSRPAARCARRTRAASGRPPPAPTPAGPRSPPWTPAWEGEGRRGRRRGLLGARPSAHGLSRKASPQQLTRQRAGSPGPASSLDSGVSPMGVAVTQVKGTHTRTHTHTGVFTHACTCTHAPAAERRPPVSYFTI